MHALIILSLNWGKLGYITIYIYFNIGNIKCFTLCHFLKIWKLILTLKLVIKVKNKETGFTVNIHSCCTLSFE